jgi:glycine/serine hydroxymethyltransferase
MRILLFMIFFKRWVIKTILTVQVLIYVIQEKHRQKHFINLIPSENFTSQAVLDALGSVMQSKLLQSSWSKWWD